MSFLSSFTSGNAVLAAPGDRLWVAACAPLAQLRDGTKSVFGHVWLVSDSVPDGFGFGWTSRERGVGTISRGDAMLYPSHWLVGPARVRRMVMVDALASAEYNLFSESCVDFACNVLAEAGFVEGRLKSRLIPYLTREYFANLLEDYYV